MSKPILWGGLRIGASIEDARAAFPDAQVCGSSLLADVPMLFDCDFVARLDFDREGLSRVTLDLARTRINQLFDDVRQQIVDALTSKYGRGQASIKRGDVYQKRWKLPYASLDIVAVNDERLPTISIVFSKSSIADAALQFL